MDNPNWAVNLPWSAIIASSRNHSLDSILVAAIIIVESAGNPLVTRYEPKCTFLNSPTTWAPKLHITVETEINGQKTSWGAMQVLGVTARDLGFYGYFTELIEMEKGVELGCRYLRRQALRYGTLQETIAAYNAGSAMKNGDVFVNQDYVDKVMGLIGKS